VNDIGGHGILLSAIHAKRRKPSQAVFKGGGKSGGGMDTKQDEMT